MTRDGALQRCDAPGCPSSFKVHYWGSVRAADAGWFFQRNGLAWCPEHVPDWVAAWRRRRAQDKP